MGSAVIYLDDDISIVDTADYSLQSGEVTVEISPEGWWRMIQALQDWLGECPHCGRLVGEPADKAPDQSARPASDAAPERTTIPGRPKPTSKDGGGET